MNTLCAGDDDDDDDDDHGGDDDDVNGDDDGEDAGDDDDDEAAAARPSSTLGRASSSPTRPAATRPITGRARWPAAYGGMVQVTARARVGERESVLVVGAFADDADVDFTSHSEVGRLTPERGVAGSGQRAGWTRPFSLT